VAKILITPKDPRFNPRPVEGQLTAKTENGEITYYMNGESFPSEIVTILEGGGEGET